MKMKYVLKCYVQKCCTITEVNTDMFYNKTLLIYYKWNKRNLKKTIEPVSLRLFFQNS